MWNAIFMTSTRRDAYIMSVSAVKCSGNVIVINVQYIRILHVAK